MERLQLALAIHCLNLPLKPAAQLASEVGAVGVQIDARNELKPSDLSETGRRQFLHFLGEHGLKIASFDLPTRRGLCDPEHLDARIAAVQETMDFAARLKVPTVTVRLGSLPAALDPAGGDLLRTVLNDLARRGNHVGVTLALGPGRDPAERVLEILKAVSQGPIGINFDPAAIVQTGGSPQQALQVLGRFAAHVLVRDAIYDSDGSGQEVPVGRGEVPWDEMVALLREMNYRGWLTIDRMQGDDRAGDAARAVQFVKSVYLG